MKYAINQPIAKGAKEAKGQELPDGVSRKLLISHDDDRGTLSELFRREWFKDGVEIRQWNHLRSHPNALRGVHAHITHEDYLFMAAGVMDLGLYDLRADSPTEGLGTLIRLEATQPELVRIPTGVAHGFYFPDQAVLFYGITHYWDRADELGCRWDDPALDIPWEIDCQPILSPRDQAAGSLAELQSAYRDVHLKDV